MAAADYYPEDYYEEEEVVIIKQATWSEIDSSSKCYNN
jgi:hypothetical protein